MVTLIKKFTWNNTRDFLLMAKKRKFVNLLNHYMIWNEHLNNDVKILTMLFCQMS
jgi:hypothetical protein